MLEHLPPARTLLSTANPLVKSLSRLGEARERRAQGLFLVEGRRAIAGFLEAGWRPAHLLVRQGLDRPPGWEAAISIAPAVAERLTQTRSASGYLAAFPLPATAPLDGPTGGLALWGISDPGNLGTLLRCAAAFGVGQVALIGGTDPWGPKAVQASAGALARLRLACLEETGGLAPLTGAPWCALVPRGGTVPEALPRSPRWLLVGGEAHGIPDDWIARCSEHLTLPMPGGTESLNAAVAGAIALYATTIRNPA